MIPGLMYVQRIKLSYIDSSSEVEERNEPREPFLQLYRFSMCQFKLYHQGKSPLYELWISF